MQFFNFYIGTSDSLYHFVQKFSSVSSQSFSLKFSYTEALHINSFSGVRLEIQFNLKLYEKLNKYRENLKYMAYLNWVKNISMKITIVIIFEFIFLS